QCDCSKDGRTVAADDVLTDDIRKAGSCRCQIHQLSDMTDNGAATICQTQTSPPGTVPAGWCYVDPEAQGMDRCPLVKDCPATDKRIIRFVNAISEPKNGATAFIMCQEKSFPAGGGGGPKNVCPAM